MATPAVAALIWLGRFPRSEVTILGLITAFAGYTAVYALNDVIDYRVDREKIQQGGLGESDDYLDNVSVRHPIAQGFLSFRDGLLWVLAWAILALIGAYILNPICVLIFLTGCALEAVYCLLLRVSHLRTIISGAVKTSGGIAAVFAVDQSPSSYYVIILFLWLFFWEVGGQNVPNDWTDIEEDKQLHARTIPVRFGPEWSVLIILGSLILAVSMNLCLLQFTRSHFELPYIAAFLFLGFYLLLVPAHRLRRTRERLHALVLFNRASYYPLSLLVVVIIKILI
jgi:4-hydroxybenzoate polyprenyltransferase